jgi:hypothetical protein
MFNFITDAISDTLDVAIDLVSLDINESTARKAVSLVRLGLDVYAVAELTGLSVEVVKALAKE